MRRWRCIESYDKNFTVGKEYTTDLDGLGVIGDDGFNYRIYIGGLCAIKVVEIKEHDGCVGCKYEHESCCVEPCYSCKQNYHQPNSKPDLWEDINNPTQKIPNPIRPNHYKSCSIECIDAMILTFGTDAVAEFCLVNAFKYIWRYKDKNGLEDIEKANWYVLKAIELGGISDTIDNLHLLIKKIKEEYNAKEN